MRERGEEDGRRALRGRLASCGNEQVGSGGSDTAGTWGAFLAGGPRGAEEEGTGLGVVDRPRRLFDPPGVERVGPALLVGHACGLSRLSGCSKERGGAGDAGAAVGIGDASPASDRSCIPASRPGMETGEVGVQPSTSTESKRDATDKPGTGRGEVMGCTRFAQLQPTIS